jgi:hypothetical protein
MECGQAEAQATYYEQSCFYAYLYHGGVTASQGMATRMKGGKGLEGRSAAAVGL